MAQANPKFVEMSPEELLSFFKSFGPEMKVTDADIRKPQPDKTQDIYRWFVKRLSGCKDVDLSQISYRVSEAGYFEFPEMHQNSYPTVILVLALNFIFNELGVGSFKIMDLVNPKVKRTIKFYGQLARFAQFNRTRSPFVEGILQKVEAVNEERAAHREQNEDLKERINQIKAAEAEKEPLCRKLTAEGEKLRANLDRDKELQMQLDSNSALLTENLRITQSALAKLQSEAEKLRTQAKKLSSMIVSSPKKYSRDVEILRQRKLQLEKEVESVQEQLVMFSGKQQRLEEAGTMVEDLLSLILEVNQELDSQKSLKLSIKPMEDSIIRLQHKITDMELTKNEKLQSLENEEGISARQKQSHLSQVNGIKAEINSWRNKVESLKKAGQQKEIAAKEVEEECRRVEEEIQTRKQQHRIDIQLLKEKQAETMATAVSRVKEFEARRLAAKEEGLKVEQMIKEGRLL